MFCKNCGTKSDGTKKFCTNCGTAFLSAATTATKADEAQIVHRPPVPNEKWTAGKIIKTAVAVVFVGGLIFLKVGLGAINSIDNTAIETNNKALDAYNSGNSDQAISQFQQASQSAVTNTNKINSLKNLAYVYSSEGEDDLSLSTFQEALALASVDSVDYFLISAEIAEIENKPNAALIAYNKADAKDPENFQVNNSLSLFYIDLYDAHPQYVDYVKALSFAQKANQLQNDNVSKKNLAIAYYFNENYTKTISLLRSVDISKDPNYAYYLGLAYAETEDTMNAKIYLRQAIAGGIKVPQSVHDYINEN